MANPAGVGLMRRSNRLSRVVALGRATLLLNLACAPRLAAPVLPAYRPAGAIDPTRAPGAEWSRHDEVLAQFGVPALRQVALAPGERELRLSEAGGFVRAPGVIWRVVEDSRGRVHGEAYVWWPTPRDGTDPTRDPEYVIGALGGRRCSARAQGPIVTACRLGFGRRPGWTRTARVLDSLGIWLDPDRTRQKASLQHVTDQRALFLERRVGSRYQSFDNFYAEWSYPSPSSDRVGALVQAWVTGGIWP